MPVAAELFRDVPVRESELRQDRDCHVRAQLVQRVLQTAANRPEVQHSAASVKAPRPESLRSTLASPVILLQMTLHNTLMCIHSLLRGLSSTWC